MTAATPTVARANAERATVRPRPGRPETVAPSEEDSITHVSGGTEEPLHGPRDGLGEAHAVAPRLAPQTGEQFAGETNRDPTDGGGGGPGGGLNGLRLAELHLQSRQGDVFSIQDDGRIRM
jgi:hypothetical protein